MKVSLFSHTMNPVETCAIAAGTCTETENEIRALKTAIESGHESVLEHASFTFLIDGITRVCLAQLTRHRIASFTVKSQRYCMSNDKIEIPVVEHSEESSIDLSEEGIKKKVEELQTMYNEMIRCGVKKEDARLILPQGIHTRLVMTMNARELRHFFNLRCCGKAQKEIRELANEILRLCEEAAPVLFENAGPSCVQYGICREKKSCGRLKKAEKD